MKPESSRRPEGRAALLVVALIVVATIAGLCLYPALYLIAVSAFIFSNTHLAMVLGEWTILNFLYKIVRKQEWRPTTALLANVAFLIVFPAAHFLALVGLSQAYGSHMPQLPPGVFVEYWIPVDHVPERRWIFFPEVLAAFGLSVLISETVTKAFRRKSR